MCDGMVDQEKVIKGLELCTGNGSFAECISKDYQFIGGSIDGSCIEMLMYNALVMLKTLDVTPEELERLKMCRAECKIDCLLEHYNKVKDELDAMKKAQEPVEPTLDIRHGKSMWRCGSCLAALQPNQMHAKFCFNCGRAVKWE